MKILSFHPKGDYWSKLAKVITIFACLALLLAFAIPSIILPQTVSAASVTVNPGQSIQSAINSAASGDTIFITPGTYYGALTISKSWITLAKAPNSSGEVIINGNQAENVITVQNASNVVFNGLSITNGTTNGILFSGSGCTGDKVINSRITEWGLASATDNSQISGGITMDGGSNLTVQGSYFQRGNRGGTSDSAYIDGTMNWYGIIIMHSSGGHQIIGNTIWGSYTNGVPNLCDSISNDDWNQPNNSFNNSLISQNAFYGVWDDVIQVDGNNNNLTIEKNYIDGMGNKSGFARALISVNPCYNGPVNIQNNILKNWGPGYVGLKMGAFTGSANGGKYVTGNTAWSTQGTFMGGTNGSAGNVHLVNNMMNVPRIQYGISIVEDYGNTNNYFAEPTISDWKYNPGTNPVPVTVVTPPATTTPLPTTTTPITSGAVGTTFGLNSGTDAWSDTGSVLNAMRFQNNAGSGNLTKMELLYSTSAPVGKVRLGVYADNNGKPGARLLDAGETNVASGWVGITNLRLPVTANAYYWLSFNQQTTNAVSFLNSGYNTSQAYHYWTSGTPYGVLPAAFNLTNAGYNLGPYVMRATVSPTTSTSPIIRTFGLSAGNCLWNQSANILDAMRYYNIAGSGTLTKLSLLVKDTTPVGKVRMGVYADNNGKPGARLLDAGETYLTNGWVTIGNLNLAVTANTYYWLAYEMQSGNSVVYQNGQAAGSHYWVNQSYGTLPVSYPVSGLYTNNSPYVMYASVAVK